MASTERRLLGARLASGMTILADLGVLVGVSKGHIHRLDDGSARITEQIAELLGPRLKVRPAYLLGAVPRSKQELLASHILSALERFDGDEMDADGPARLLNMRLSKGFATASAAALANGWKISTYGSHEAGRKPIPVEKMVTYALGFGSNIAYALHGQVPVLAPAGDPVHDYAPMPPDVHDKPNLRWRWLRETTGADRSILPLVRHSGSGWELASGGGVTLPDFLTGPLPLHYGLLQQSGRTATIMIINPSRNEGRLVSVNEAGVVEVRKSSNAAPARDLIRYPLNPGESAILGLLVATMTLEV